MSLPFFYVDAGLAEGALIEPGEDTAKHMVQVLRMREGDRAILTDGRGHSAECTIVSATRGSCTLRADSITETHKRSNEVTLAISLLKNANRFEWFLEKAAELGVSRIVPLLCGRTERQHFRKDRAASILVSAMQQSRQSWLTVLEDPIDLLSFIARPFPGRRFLAHCMEGEREPLRQTGGEDALILIGPEGDFTPEELSAALHQGFRPVSLGETRLRTETAGLAAAVILCV
jgi:16S rRNA (uracil1498-N3)-methyltransferase